MSGSPSLATIRTTPRLHYLFLDTSANPPRKTGIQTSNAEEGAMKGRAVWFYPDKDTNNRGCGRRRGDHEN
jgi:hypothetical protein